MTTRETLVRKPYDDPMTSYKPFPVQNVQFCHPAYKAPSNVLLQFGTYDGKGIHYQTAHTACAIVANNRWDGYFTADIEGQQRVNPKSSDDCLQDGIYYFHVPNGGIYPIVPTFADWSFPHDNLPSSWSSLSNSSTFNPKTCFSQCAMTRSVMPLKTVRLVPENASGMKWFRTNSMLRYGQYTSPANVLRLRVDVYEIFEQKPRFAIVPKSGSLVAHIFDAPDETMEAVQLYQNVPLHNLGNIRLEYLLARLAWTLFPCLEAFLSAGEKRNLTVLDDDKVRIEEMLNGDQCYDIYVQSSTTSGSKHALQSRKRARNTSEADQSWEFVQTPSYSASDGAPAGSLHESGRKRKRDASSQHVRKREQSHHGDLKQHYKLAVGTEQDVSLKLTDPITVADTMRESEASAERDYGIASTSDKVISRLEVVEQNEAFIEEDDDFVYDHTKVILRQGKQYFSAKVEDRSFQPTDSNIASLDITPIPSEHFCPKIEHDITEVRKVRPNTYIKRPSLLSWEPSDTNSASIGELVLQEAKVCEILKVNPHPNIAEYYGCLVEAERIVGLCFVRYTSTISERLEGSSLARRKAYVDGIERGIHHIHQLGLIHNDLNPSNILMDGEVPVIIDFDSCRHKGEKLGHKAGTFDWELEEAEIAEPENDIYSLAKIREFILGTSRE